MGYRYRRYGRSWELRIWLWDVGISISNESPAASEILGQRRVMRIAGVKVEYVTITTGN